MPQQLIPHINHALVPKPHTPMYLMHKFWARKPDNVVSEYINHYSRKGGITLDPFCGSGVTPIESLRLRRKTIATDIDPISTFITRMSIVPVDLIEYETTFESIKENVKSEIDELYQTTCPKCGGKAHAICTYWHNDEATDIRNLLCPIDGMVRDKVLDSKDKKNLESIEKKDVPFWFPKDKLQYANGKDFKEGTHVKGLDSVPSLFTHRNLIALAILNNEIESIQSKNIRDLMKFALSSTIAQTTKMMLWSSSSRPSWKVHRYWVPPDNVELNVWDRFENRYFDVLEGKKEAKKTLGSFVAEGQNFDDLIDGKDFVISTQSALRLNDKPASIPSNSIDYVFTDPPYGGSVQYMELSAMWLSWLKGKDNDPRFQLNFDEEVTINDSQGKDFDFYHKMLRASFEEVYRVLKPDHWLTVTFHNTEIRIYNSIIKAIVLSGFDLEKIVYQPPAKKGAKQQLQPYGSAIGDYYIRFRKPLKRVGLPTESGIDQERYERIVVDAVKRVIAKRGEPTPYSLIINSYASIYNDLKKNGYYLTEPESIDKVLKKQLNKEFVITRGKWWFKDPNSVPFIERVPLNERVELSVMGLLYRKVKVAYDEILQEVFIKFPNTLTPETQSVMDVLKENAKKTPDGNWMLDPNVKKRFNEHDSIVEKIALIGQKLGYEVHADLQGWRKDAFPQISSENAKHVKEIDVVWYTKQEISHEFEVENTTGFWSAIVRGSSIPSTQVKRFMVIPDEKLRSFNDRLNVPVLQERIKQEHWKYILYDPLKAYFDVLKRRKQLPPETFESISKKPEVPKKVTESLELFTAKQS
jgi:16S rRNA G966 N2-methylase RsmD